jgi:hypothetical protein
MHELPVMDAKLATAGFNVNVVQQPSRTDNKSAAKKPKAATQRRKKQLV